jgi:hypothetical protein
MNMTPLRCVPVRKKRPSGKKCVCGIAIVALLSRRGFHVGLLYALTPKLLLQHSSFEDRQCVTDREGVRVDRAQARPVKLF